MNHNLKRKLSRRIKSLREQSGLTQEEVAKKARMQYRYYQKIEGKSPKDMRHSTMARIANALGVTVSKLLQYD